MLELTQLIGFGAGGGIAITGTYGNAPAGAGRTLSVGQSGGLQFVATETGGIAAVKLDVNAVAVADTYEMRLYSNNAGSPGTQVGSSGGSQSISTTGAKTFSFTTFPPIARGVTYWLVLVPSAGGGIDLDTCANDAGYGSGRDATITSIVDNLPASEDWRFEISQAF